MQKKALNKSRLYRHKGGLEWQGIKTEKYKPKGGDWADIVRRVIVGKKGETARFHLRYFEISPGGYSSLEKHKHEHVVICEGKGHPYRKKQYTQFPRHHICIAETLIS